MALMLLVGAFVVIWRSGSGLQWHALPLVVAALLFLPWIQFLVGLLPFAGQAWLSSGYLLGFLLALLIGARWESVGPGQLMVSLITAIGLAAIASVGLQLYTWSGLSSGGALGILALGDIGARQSANLGQPNQLATLLTWGLLACFWAYLRGKLSATASIFTAAYLVLGLALTQSRMGFLSASVVLLAIWLWRRLWPSCLVPWTATGLYAFLLGCPALFRFLDAALLLGHDTNYVRLEQQSELRLGASRLFLQAIVERPFFGYGWTEVAAAQIAVADQFPGLSGIFAHSHNLLLDLALWIGLPLGLLVMAALFRWFWLALRAIRRPDEAVVYLMLVVIGIHAFVEFPLQYAYFLIPVGLFMGTLNVNLGVRVIWTSPKWLLAGLWLTVAISLGVTLRDYARVDASYTTLRLEQGLLGQGRPPMGGPPDVWVLTHMREWIKIARYKAHENMTRQELDEMVVMTTSYPSLSSAYRLASALALNERPVEARAWLVKICLFTDDHGCSLAKRTWETESQNAPALEAIDWPK